MEIYTIGHSNHPLGEFIRLLRLHDIQNVVDVRRFPSSRRNPHFARTNLEKKLAEENLRYFWLESLGGFRRASKKPCNDSPNSGWRSPGFRAYADYMITQEFLDGIVKLLEIARSGRTALMCAEALYFRCHRRLISDWLVANGVCVAHIRADGKLSQHALTPFARVEGGKLAYPGVPTFKQCLRCGEDSVPDLAQNKRL